MSPSLRIRISRSASSSAFEYQLTCSSHSTSDPVSDAATDWESFRHTHTMRASALVAFLRDSGMVGGTRAFFDGSLVHDRTMPP